MHYKNWHSLKCNKRCVGTVCICRKSVIKVDVDSSEVSGLVSDQPIWLVKEGHHHIVWSYQTSTEGSNRTTTYIFTIYDTVNHIYIYVCMYIYLQAIYTIYNHHIKSNILHQIQDLTNLYGTIFCPIFFFTPVHFSICQYISNTRILLVWL